MNKLFQRRKLYATKLKEDKDVQVHIKSMIEVFDKFAVIGDEVESFLLVYLKPSTFFVEECYSS